MSYFILYFQLIIFIILSGVDSRSNILFSKLSGELNLIELFQVLLIFISIFLLIKQNILIKKEFNKLSFYTKLAFFIILLYEELSFLTYKQFNFLSRINDQSELNLHNLKIMTSNSFFENLPYLGKFTVINELSIRLLIYIFISLLIGFGSYFKFLNKFSFFFLTRKFSLFSLAFLINYYGSIFLIKLGLIDFPLMKNEFLELFFYSLFLVDLNYTISLKKRKSL